MKNDLLRRLEAKAELKYAALYQAKMRMTLQIAQDAAMIAANEVLTHSGEENVNAKLSKKKVKEARQKRFLYHTKYIDLATEYGVCKKTIMDAVKGKSWKCVNYLPAPPEKEE